MGLRFAKALIFGLLIAAPSASEAQVPIYTSGNPPATPALTSLPLLTSVTKDGITWSFQNAVRVGQFVTGDYYVVGNVTVVSISPTPAGGRNGSVLNLPGCRPPNVDKSGFDSRTQGERYSSSVAVTLPVQLGPGDALTSSISVTTIGTFPRVGRPEDATTSPVRSISVLTSVASPLPPDAFRPSYCGRQTGFYYSRNLRRNTLPNLAPVAGTPAISQFAGYFRRPWVDTLFFGFDAPVEYMPDYGREVGRVVGQASLLLLLNVPAAEREALLVYFVQYGIDLYGVVSAGHPGWTGWGGHGSGRKFPILFAGAMLGVSSMASSIGGADFGEDVQTLVAKGPPYGPGWAGQTAMYAGHMGLTGESINAGWGPYEHLQPRDWISFIGEDYRRCCTSIAWIGEALAAKVLGLQAAWGHDAFFAYTTRWMTEDDSAQVAGIRTQTGRDYSASWQRQRQTWDPFVSAMWSAYFNLPSTSAPGPPQNLRVVQ